MNKAINILFVGNSHTYFNDMPLMVRRRAREAGYDCRVTMIAHGGWFLYQHAKEPDVRFNILFGNYDYVILQEHSQPIATLEEYGEAAEKINGWIREAGSRPVIYETWAKKKEPEKQAEMNEIHRAVAKRIGALLAPAGEHWWAYQKAHPQAEMYAPDGFHASPAGSEFAAEYIWETIRQDFKDR